jgi:hypothetical protein
MIPKPPNEEPLPDFMEDIWEEFAERAAIMQHDGGMSMQKAEIIALQAAFRRMGDIQPATGEQQNGTASDQQDPH